LSGRGLCDELITRSEESYRLCCVVVCDLETSRIGAPYIYDISHLRVNVVCRPLNADKSRFFVRDLLKHVDILVECSDFAPVFLNYLNDPNKIICLAHSQKNSL